MQSIELRVARLEADLARLLAKKPILDPSPAPAQVMPKHVLDDLLIFIRGAGTAGVPAAIIRDRHHFMRRAIGSGNPLPSELAAAGIMRRKVGKGWWYYIPDFL